METISVAPVNTPLGEMLMAVSERGLLSLTYQSEMGQSEIGSLLWRIRESLPADAEVDRAKSAAIADAERQLGEYFAGGRRQWDLEVDWRLSKGFRAKVLQELCNVGYGQTCSYGELAEAVGNPKAARAVGTAMATNPISIVVPCHRVVRSGGNIGNYGGGSEVKRLLLAMEAGEIMEVPKMSGVNSSGSDTVANGRASGDKASSSSKTSKPTHQKAA